MNDHTPWELRINSGAPFTLSTDDTLSLHFDGQHIQSMMSLHDPYRLHLHYTQAMMAFKLFKQNPETILIVGLGGGSLSKYCFRRFPEASIVTLEIAQDVISLRDKFKIPRDSERFRVVHTDAGDHMRHVENIVDVLLLDGFDATGIPDNLCSTHFYRDCHRALVDGGLVVANLSGDDRGLHDQIGRLADVFDGNCLIGYARGCNNYIVVARNGTEQLCDDVSTDVHRLLVKHKKGLHIPDFKTFKDFYRR